MLPGMGGWVGRKTTGGGGRGEGEDLPVASIPSSGAFPGSPPIAYIHRRWRVFFFGGGAGDGRRKRGGQRLCPEGMVNASGGHKAGDKSAEGSNAAIWQSSPGSAGGEEEGPIPPARVEGGGGGGKREEGREGLTQFLATAENEGGGGGLA